MIRLYLPSVFLLSCLSPCISASLSDSSHLAVPVGFHCTSLLYALGGCDLGGWGWGGPLYNVLCLCVRVCAWVCMCMCVCACVWTCVCVYACMYVCACAGICVKTRVFGGEARGSLYRWLTRHTLVIHNISNPVGVSEAQMLTHELVLYTYWYYCQIVNTPLYSPWCSPLL